VQVVGVPDQDFDFGDAQAVVVALKSRTIPANEAVQQSRAVVEVLLAAGAEQIVFKYCSTFDSTPQGNIGPVAEALLDLLREPLTIACPAFPANKRTIYKGHLFVGDQLLSDSPMKDHPLTPMRDANLVRVLQAQTGLPVGLVAYEVVRQGAAAIAWAFKDALARGERMLIVDAITDDDLREIGAAAAGMKLITGGSGIAIGLPENLRKAGKLQAAPQGGTALVAPSGKAVILAGSCSTATRRQIETAQEAGMPSFKIDPVDVNSGEISVEGVLAWMKDVQGIPLVYSSAEPDAVRNAQAMLGRERAGTIIEHFLGELAVRLRGESYRRFLVAGGETSGAVVAALGVKAMRIGPEIDPGVPWTLSLGDAEPLALALKSGNFGADDFFIKAWDLLR
jgi:uncharacterized protein YgbK (DUF1537 family)